MEGVTGEALATTNELREIKVEVPQGELPDRLDKFLLTCNLNLSRTAVNKLFQENCVKVNGGDCKKGHKVR